MSGLKFGTSGLRGLVTELGDDVCRAYTIAFLKHLQSRHAVPADGLLLVGYDLRASSPRIAAACIGAAKAFGMRVENCGPLPTPALALRALSLKVPAIMVTGSHIPADRNGLKFYRPDGEIDKSDEAGILAFLDLEKPAPSKSGDAALSGDALRHYVERCSSLLAPGALSGKRIGVYQHSSVARDIMVDILAKAGADAIGVGHSDSFVPVDTEALRPEDIAFAEKTCRELKLDALVSTDGDADRPLISDENGHFLRGDMVGLLTARFLDADAVVTPVTSNSSIEHCGFFDSVYRTRVGSPYVIEGMNRAGVDGRRCIVGFEANGGVLLGTSVAVDNQTLDALPTRDAMLPILSVLGMAAKEGLSLSRLVDGLPARFTGSGRIEHVAADESAAFLKSLEDAETMKAFFADAGSVRESDRIDGTRVVLSSGELVHYRASGNAPELRCYTEAASRERAAELLAWGLERARRALGDKEFSR
ncbi:phosphomannomutase [Phyllobacterium phragmitis]|uniref:Phosphomannomutase n=1 Tax=Phyllobacterium phragmitis TaxID=2670329 RepID=A0A2S9IZM8_9HYPH|nr:phosphomannomutase [Phyllobacterium phragmitis]PRD45987.1 phosphomannomutase [Phyllobacterium phragmitis]